MNKLFLIGNLTRDPELRQTDSGLMVCNFTLAVNKRPKGDHPEADYFRVTVWRELGERCAQYLAKGKKAAVVGTAAASAYIARDGTPKAQMEVTADQVEFLSPKGGTAPITDEQGFVQVPDEDLPAFE